jgi:hypothetical protein
MAKHIVNRTAWSLLVLALLTVTGCGRSPRVTRQPLPDRDIVFQLSHHYASEKHIGFINADGSGFIVVAITHQRTSTDVDPRPFWTSDGQLLLFAANFERGLLGITSDGMLRKYSRWIARAAPLRNPSLVVLLTAFDESRSEIALFDLDTSQIIRSFVVEDEDHPSIGTSALSGSMLVYRRWWIPDPGANPLYGIEEIVLVDIDTGEEQVLARREGEDAESYLDSPAISPDGEWVVYTAADGLHLVRPDGNDDRLLLPMDVVREDVLGERTDLYPPEAAWSPDSGWLVYHRCVLPTQRICGPEADQYAIFKLNIETGEEVLLVEGGVNPYWRLAPSAEAE